LVKNFLLKNVELGEGISLEEAAELKKKRTFRKFTFRGIDLDALLDKSR
jgi:small subunit ribosomal protein S15e